MRETVAKWMEFYNTDHPHQVISMEYPIHRFLAGLIDIKKYLIIGTAHRFRHSSV